jgi:peptide/nickel transport system ATP-binding protein
VTETLVRPKAAAPAARGTALEIKDLAIDFGAARPAVESVSLTVEPGEIVALVGESGSGKSMTARAVLGLLPAQSRVSGQILFDGRDLLALSDTELNTVRGSRIAMVFQEPQSSLNPVRTIAWQLTQVLRAHGRISRRDARARALELLTQVEIPDPQVRLDQYPHQLSGGQKQRVVLAIALANNPEILLADEPTTALDVTVQREILGLLRRLRDTTGMSIVMITHNMGVVGELADRVVVLRAGNVLETGKMAEVFARPAHPYTRQLLDSVMELPGSEHEAPVPAARLIPAALPVPAARHAAGVVPALEYRGVEVHFQRGREARFPAVNGVDLIVRPGEVVGLVGESGSGKTTLGRLAVGLAPLSAGSVHLDGVDLGAASRDQARGLRSGLAIVHQDPAASLDPRLSVGQSIREPLDIAGTSTRSERDARVRELLEAVHLPTSYAERRPHELSGGQRQRIALARALVNRPSLVVADEPTSALDVSVQATVLELFRELQTELSFACLFISHDLAVVHRVADRVVVLRRGEIVESGDADRVLTAPEHEYTRALVGAVPRVQHLRAGHPVPRDA